MSTETLNTTTGELVTVDPSSEVAVTGYLRQCRDLLAIAVEQSGPEQVVLLKAEIATAAEATKQLNLSKEIQEDAVEMVRRAEFAVVKAIRKGQESGEIVNGRGGDHGNQWTGGKTADIASAKPTPTDFEPNLYANGSQLIEMTEGVSDEQFDEALAEAKAEGNLSRANVVRKVKGYVTPDKVTRDDRAEIVRDLADKGWSSHQMTDRVGISEESIRKIGRDYGIPIPADRALFKQRRVNANDIVDNLVIGLEGSVMSLDLVDLTDLDRELAQYWATSLTESLQKLNRFAKQIKEIAQ